MRWKQHFFGLAPHFSKIELLAVVLGCSSCSKHCSKLLIESHYCKTKKMLFRPSPPYCKKLNLCRLFHVVLLVLRVVLACPEFAPHCSKHKIKPRPVRWNKHLFGLAPHFSKIELLPVVLGCSSCSKYCAKLSIESHYCKTKKMLFWPSEPFFHKNWTFVGCSRLFYLFWELFWIVLDLLYIVRKY